MAKKKKEQELQYLQMPLPEGQKRGKMTKVSWSGINYRQTKDTGEISKELNISTDAAPYLTPSEKKRTVKEGVFDIFLKDNGLGIFEEKDFFETTGAEAIARDIKYIEGLFVIQGVFEVDVNSDGGTEKVLKNIYQIYDGNFKLTGSTVVERIPKDCSGSGIAEFRYFESFKNIANVSTGKRLLYFPPMISDAKTTVYSQSIPETVILKRHFHNAENDMVRDSRIGLYLVEKCTKEGVYYLVECATDRDKEGNPRFPGGESYSYDDSYNSLEASINRPRGGDLRHYYFNIQRPYCVKDSNKGYGYYRLRTSEHVEAEAATKTLGMPEIYYACVAHQRLFGINDECVYASGYNDYANWELDTADNYSAENAWMSSTQSTSGGENTGIIAYGGAVFVFKKDVTFEITNTKNPFRIREAFSVGAIDQKGIQVVGNYLIFVSEDGVKLYNGSSLADIGYVLNIDRINEVVTGTDGKKFYMSARINDEDELRLFVYDSVTGLWSEEYTGNEKVIINEGTEDEEILTAEIDRQVEFVGFTNSDNGFYGLSSSGKVYRLDTENYDHEWMMETDFILNNTVDIKHINKVQLFAELSPGAKITAHILYDDEEFSEETSHLIIEKENNGEETIKVPIRVVPRKTANYGFKIRIEGYGFVKLYQMELLITDGGEKYISG